MVLLHVSLHRKEIIQAEVCGDTELVSKSHGGGRYGDRGKFGNLHRDDAVQVSLLYLGHKLFHSTIIIPD